MGIMASFLVSILSIHFRYRIFGHLFRALHFRVSLSGIAFWVPVVTQVDGLGEVLHGDHGVLRHVLVHHLSSDLGRDFA